MTAITQALSAALLHFVWQGFAVALLLWMALFVLRNASANVRYIAGCGALVVLVLLPAITACVLYTRPVMVPAVEFVHSVSQPVRSTWTTSERAPGVWLVRAQLWALPTWSLGVLLFSLRLVWGARQVATLRRRGLQAEDAVLAMLAEVGRRMGLTRPVRVLISTITEGPSVVGWIRPVILFPSATILGLTPQQLEAVLAHEIAHIRRNDYLVNTLQLLVEALLFYHPAVWWTSARIRHERELCCDDLAVRSCGDALCYARALTTLERLRVMAPSLALGSTDGPLLFRIQRLIGAEKQEHMPSKLPGIVALSLGVACLALNINWVRAQAQVRSPEAGQAELASGPQVRDARGVQVDFGGAAVLHRMPVEYPEAAIAKGVQGAVVVEATVDARGQVDDAHVLSGPPELRKTALESVLNWHFLPDGAGNTREVHIAFKLPALEVNRGIERTETNLDNERAALARKLVSLMEARGEPNDEISEREGRVNLLREELENLQKRQASEQQQGDKQPLQARLAELQAELADAERGLEQARQGNASLAGRKLRSIRVLGLSSQGWHKLLSQLPVHVEDTLSQDSIEATGRAIEAFDEHLEFRVIPLEGGRAELEINAPGAAAANREERAVTHPEAEKESARRLFFPAAGGVTIMPSPPRSETLLSGRTLKIIDVRGLSEQSRDELTSLLPVHLGDKLSRDSINAIGAAVRQFDEHLELNLIAIENGEVELRIVAPGIGLR